MALALQLRRSGWQVTLIEADPEWRVYGAGITVTGPTYRAFRTLGILADLAAEGFFVEHGSRICAADGTTLNDLVESPLEPDLPVVGGIMRPMLHRLLARRVRESGADVRLGRTIATFDDDGQGVTATLDDGTNVRADILVGADGIFSATRRALFPDAPDPQYTGQYCWRLLSDRPAAIDRAHFFVGSDIVAGLMPVSPKTMYMWLLDRQPQQAKIEDAHLRDRLRKLMAPFSGVLGDVRDAISDDSIVNVRPLVSHLLPDPWYRGNAILIGDAAHGTTPHLASGAGIAVEDAIVLAEELDRAHTAAAAFAAFMARRFERCRMVVENSVAIGRMQQEHASPDKLGAMMAASQAALLQPI